MALTQSTPSHGFHTDLLIDGSFQAGTAEKLKVISPVSEELVAEVPGASLAQVDMAVKAAAKAFNNGCWSDPAFRKACLLKLADLIKANRDALMDALLDELGSPVNLKASHVDQPATFLRWFAENGTKDRTRQLGPNATNTAVSVLAYRPIGVVAAITAFNYPLMIGLTKTGAALASGCTVVLMTSPLAPLATLMLGKLVIEAGIPSGVVNIIAGGIEAGKALTEHPLVDKVSFTGSVNVGRQVMQQAASNLTPTVLELGGKSAAILLPGVDFERYAFQLHTRYARNAGQGCGSPTRILVEESRYEEFCEVSRRTYAKIKVGDPRDPETIVGPLVSQGQRDRIEARLNKAVCEGATIIAGGGRPDINKGWFLNPALVGGLTNEAELAREELFGPVSVVLTYRTVDEAIAIANDSDMGLKGYLFGPVDECIRLAARLRVGTVTINGGSPLRPDAPMMGYKQSGVGSEWGEDGLLEFVRPQHIDIPL